LLQLSGIGPAPWLEGLGIPLVQDLPGVGQNLQDHLQIRSVYKVNNAKTLNTLASSQGLLWSPDEGLYKRDAAGKKGEFITDELDDYELQEKLMMNTSLEATTTTTITTTTATSTAAAMATSATAPSTTTTSTNNSVRSTRINDSTKLKSPNKQRDFEKQQEDDINNSNV
jgi:choline dehydrogenase-like flavoprotein